MIKKVNKTRIIATTLAFLMLLSIFALAADAVTPNASANTQARISQLREEQARLERERRSVQSRINDYEFDRLSQVAQKDVLDDRMELTWQEIENVTEVIELYEQLIIEKEIEVREAQDRERQQLENYRARVRSMEENGVITYLEILFDSTSFADLLARWDFVGDIMRADERAYNNLIAARKETEAAEEALRQQKEDLGEEKVLLEYRQAELSEQIEEANVLIVQLMETIEGEQALYNQMASSSRRINAEIDRLVEQARREEAARRAAAERAAREAREAREAANNNNNNNNNSGGGGGSAPASPPSSPPTGSGQLMWPVSGRVGSEFGPRGGRMHLGIDIMAPTGTPIVAADGGTVITVSFDRGWGNFVVINHGNGMTTLYAHMNTMSVSRGQTVSRGQQIGTVGSTGNATAPHLHFEVRINGAHVNPRTVLP